MQFAIRLLTGWLEASENAQTPTIINTVPGVMQEPQMLQILNAAFQATRCDVHRQYMPGQRLADKDT